MNVFPAHAGMSLPRVLPIKCSTSFPRTRGDEPLEMLSINERTVFSPHTRG